MNSLTPQKKKILLISGCAAAAAVVIGLVVFLLITLLGGNSEPPAACQHPNKVVVESLSTPATCTQDGQKVYDCPDCDDPIDPEPVSKLSHAYVIDASSVAATCEANGKKVEKCSACNDVKETVLTKLNHAYAVDSAASVAASCTATGKNVYKCANCADTYEATLAKIDHTFVKKDDECVTADCTTAGTTVSYCSGCQQKKVEDTDALGHDWHLPATTFSVVDLKAGDCQKRECSRCTAVAEATAAHNYLQTADSATCTADGDKTYVCTGCNESYTTFSARKGHTVTNWVTQAPPSEPKAGTTCTYEYTDKGTCEVCQGEVTSSYDTEIHKTYVLEETVPATCTVAGQKNLFCKDCGVAKPNSKPVSYYAEHVYNPDPDNNNVPTCVCGDTLVTFTGETATLTPAELAQSVQLGSGAVIRLPNTAAGQVTGDNAELNANKFTKDALSPETPGLDRVGAEDEIFNLTLTDGDTPITEFGGASVTVKLPYTLKPTDDPSAITIFFLGVNGVEPMDAIFTPDLSTPEENDGFVTFQTTHFSYYLVGLYSNAEYCKKYGHNYLIQEKKATCTEGGYYIESCRRCGEFGRRDFFSALGHTAQPISEEPATCTENGVRHMQCQVPTCGVSFDVVLPATGHNYVELPGAVAASCTTAGKRVEQCTNANCTAQNDFITPQLPHSLRSVVTEPKCSLGGYTTHTCQTCEGYSYTNNFTPATGHNWDHAEPTCAAGQKCLVCGEAGLPATGVHTMADGKCSVCGYGCEHVDGEPNVVLPTCTVGGYSVYTCTKCARAERRDYTNPTGHSYPNNFEPCTACGAESRDFAEAIENLVKSLASDAYTLNISDVKLLVQMTQKIGDHAPDTETEMDLTLDLATLSLKKTENGVIIYLDGSFTAISPNGSNVADNEITGGITAYGDGTYLYVKLTSLGQSTAPYRISYDAAIDMAVSMVMGGGSSGGTGGPGGPSIDTDRPLPPAQEDNSADIEDMQPLSISLYNSEEEPVEEPTLEDMLNGMLETILTHPIAAPWVTLLQENTSAMYAAFGRLYLSFFKSEAVAGGYKYNYDIDRIQAYHEDLYSLTMAEFVDKYCGEGATDEIFAYLNTLRSTKITDFVSDLLAFADENGLPSELVIDTVNRIVIMMMGDPSFDILDFLDLQFAGMTVENLYSMLLSQVPPSTAAQIPALDEIFKLVKDEMTANAVYDYIPEDYRSMIFESYNMLLDSSHVYFFFTTDNAGELASVEFGYKNFEMDINVSELEGEDVAFDQTGMVRLNFAVALLFSADIPANADAVKTEFEALYAKFDASVKAAYAVYSADPENADQMLVGLFTGMLTVKDGVIYVLVPDYATETLIETPASELFMITIDKDCVDLYCITLMTEMYGGNRLYFNEKTNAFSHQSAHLYDIPWEGEYPEGYYATYEEAPCGSYYGELFKCKCGDFTQDIYTSSGGTKYKYHESYRVVTSSGDCEDGVLYKYVCRHCNQVTQLSSSQTGWGSTTTIEGSDTYMFWQQHYCTETPIVIQSNHGEAVFYKGVCPCGWTESFSFEPYTNGIHTQPRGCIFDFDTLYHDDLPEPGTYHCALATCDISVKVEWLDSTGVAEPNKNGNPCSGCTLVRYTIERNGEEVEHHDVKQYMEVHSMTVIKDVDALNQRAYYAKCQKCRFEIYTEWTRDVYGRSLYDLNWTKRDGEYISYYESKNELVAGETCRFRHSYRNSADAEFSTYTNEHHVTAYQTLIPGTCTQPTVTQDACTLCDYSYADYSYHWSHVNGTIGHDWVENTDGNGFAYKCDRCDMYSDKNASDIVLEDLGNSGYAIDGSYVIGWSDYRGKYLEHKDLTFLFSFVKKGENYGDLETVAKPASAIVASEVSLSYFSNHGRYRFGQFSFTKASVYQAASMWIGQEGITETTVEEFLQNYDLAIQVKVTEPANIGTGYDGLYSVIVLEDLISCIP